MVTLSPFEPHILVVDDDKRIRKLLQKFLVKNGYWASVAQDAENARELLRSFKFDLIVLDVMMPGDDGISFTGELRQEILTPILLLTARGEIADRIAGFEAGADDYLAKPFEPKELLLRINAILRRVVPTENEADDPLFLSLGEITYDIERAELMKENVLVRLTTSEVALMRIFSANVGVAISRKKLVEDLGKGKGLAQERAVDVQITRLRRKIEFNPKVPRYLQTVRGVGYLLAPD
jgi:two-component system phosphate regulon response regulator OmpR